MSDNPLLTSATRRLETPVAYQEDIVRVSATRSDFAASGSGRYDRRDQHHGVQETTNLCIVSTVVNTLMG